MRTQKPEEWPGSHTVALVVIDIEDSTGWVVGLGDADWLALLLDHRRIVRERMAEFGGTELTTTGDGFILAFPHIDAATRCVTAIQADHLRGAERPGRHLRLRIGVHAGTIRPVPDGTWAGRDLHLVARVAAAAAGGEILLTGEAAARGRDLDASVSGERRAALRGFPGEHPLVTVEWS